MYKKSDKITLSYSTINMIHERPHCWINKQAGVKKLITPEKQAIFDAGKEAHAIIQGHVSHKNPNPMLARIPNINKVFFPIVEEKDFDERCKFTLDIGDPRFEFVGFIDGQNPEENIFLEIKSSSSLWSVAQFQNAMQRKIYALAKPEYHTGYLITCHKDPNMWPSMKPKIYDIPCTQQDRDEAMKWIHDAIAILDAGDLTSDLINGECHDSWCDWGANCIFAPKG